MAVTLSKYIEQITQVNLFSILGFASSELCTRIEHAEPKVVISASCGVEPNKVIPYLDILHEVNKHFYFTMTEIYFLLYRNSLTSS